MVAWHRSVMHRQVYSVRLSMAAGKMYSDIRSGQIEMPFLVEDGIGQTHWPNG